MMPKHRIWKSAMDKNEKQFFQDLGCRISDFRKQLGMTQTQLGDKLDLSQQIIASYEAGQRHISIWRLFALAKSLDIEPDQLLGTKNHIPQKRGPVPKLQRQMEKISSLPLGEQKSIIQVLDMALSSA